MKSILNAEPRTDHGDRYENIAKLEAELAETKRVRDQWCAEYTKVRDEIDAIKRSREQERDYANICDENARLRELLLDAVSFIESETDGQPWDLLSDARAALSAGAKL